MAASAILDLFYVYLEHSRREFVGLCHCAKFGWNRFSSFDDMPVLIFCEFGLKMVVVPEKLPGQKRCDKEEAEEKEEEEEHEFLGFFDVFLK